MKAAGPRLVCDHITVALDLAAGEHQVVIVDGAGKRLTRFSIAHSRPSIAELLRRSRPERWGMPPSVSLPSRPPATSGRPWRIKWSPQGSRVPCPLVLGVHLQGKELQWRDLRVAHPDRLPATRAADHDHLERLDELLAQIALERGSLEPLADVAKQVTSTCSTFTISAGPI
jgi:hypothetical protein